MKRVLFIALFTIMFSFKSYGAIATFKINIDNNYALLKGTITIASSGKETVELSLNKNMQLHYTDNRVKYNKKTNKYIMEVNEKFPVILSYIKKPSEYMDIIDNEFISIYSSIIPNVENISQTELYITLPKDFKGLINGFSSLSVIDNQTSLYSYTSLPKEIYLAASKNYDIKTITQNKIQIYTMMFKEHEKLSYTFLQNSAYYIEMYEKLFNKAFPFKSFIVIEDKRPYGHAMNGIAVFGTSIIDKPFVLERSLGHEILHQYFGCAIECNMTDGNFLEAITTYFSDYFYEKDNRIKYRKGILAEYIAYGYKDGYPLKDFVYNKSRLDQSVGYGKGLMVLHMAKNIVGEEAFMNGIRNFIKDKFNTQSSWHDLLSYIGTNEDFYNYWINNKNNIALYVDKIAYNNKQLSFNLIRKGGQEVVDIPYTITSNNEKKLEYIKTNMGNNQVNIKLKHDNDTVVIDEGYHLMRYLYPEELPAAFYFLLGNDSIVFAGGRNEDKYFKEVFSGIDNVVNIRKLGMHHIKDKNLIISIENQVPSNVAELLSKHITFNFHIDKTTYAVIKNPYSNGSNFILFAFNFTEESLKKLNRYGSYSYIVFNNNQVINKQEDNTPMGIKIYGK